MNKKNISMNQIKFKPFQGPNYANSRFKILVLGESHYANEFKRADMVNPTEEIQLFTNTIINKFLNYKIGTAGFESWMNTFTKFSNVYEGKKLDNLECQIWWNNVAFYNYIQVPMGSARISPTMEDFENSYNAFVEVCEALKPDFIIFWGYRLYGKMNQKDMTYENVPNRYNLNFLNLDRKYPFLTVPHPSSRHHNNSQTAKYEKYLNDLKFYHSLNNKL